MLWVGYLARFLGATPLGTGFRLPGDRVRLGFAAGGRKRRYGPRWPQRGQPSGVGSD